MKHRKLIYHQQVILIYITGMGYTKEPAIFKHYKTIQIGSVDHEIPIFEYNDKEISGLECFWLLPENAINDEYVSYIQRQLAPLQVISSTIAKEMNYFMPEKVRDKQIQKMVDDNIDQLQNVINKLGFDPRDEIWLDDLAEGQREKNWFKYERENGIVFSDRWNEVTTIFNTQFSDNISIDQAKNLSKKRMRYWLGAHYTRWSGNANKNDWFVAAKRFEVAHREREGRMLRWSLLHKNKFPFIRAKQDIRFWPGPYFHQFLEKCPQLFTDLKLQQVKSGTMLRVISYDPQDKYIRLDFTADIRHLIKPDEKTDAQIWLKDEADYDLWIKPEQFESHLEIIEPIG